MIRSEQEDVRWVHRNTAQLYKFHLRFHHIPTPSTSEFKNTLLVTKMVTVQLTNYLNLWFCQFLIKRLIRNVVAGQQLFGKLTINIFFPVCRIQTFEPPNK